MCAERTAINASGLTPSVHADIVTQVGGVFVRHWFAPILLLLPLSLAAQVPSVAAKAAGAATVKTWTLGRTVDGQPDLQGTWTNASNVPLERPANLGTKEFYTPEEAAAKAQAGFQGDRPVTVEAHYDLSQFGLDPSQGKFAPNLRTSLIIGPEGRVPTANSGSTRPHRSQCRQGQGPRIRLARKPSLERALYPVAEPGSAHAANRATTAICRSSKARDT